MEQIVWQQSDLLHDVRQTHWQLFAQEYVRFLFAGILTCKGKSGKNNNININTIENKMFTIFISNLTGLICQTLLINFDVVDHASHLWVSSNWNLHDE